MAKSKRKAISKKVRFEVFKRDAFQCQYCGKKAPDVVLHVDHIKPVSGGGTNDIMNLVTSCVECNLGKGARELGDDSALVRQRTELELLHERREQIDMLLRWREGLKDIKDQEIEAIVEAVEDQHDNQVRVGDEGRKEIRKWLRRYSLSEILESVDISFEQYLRKDNRGRIDQDSANTSWKYIPRIARMRQVDRDKPHLKELLYARGILRKRFSYFDAVDALKRLEDAYDAGCSIEELKRLARTTRHWTQFKADLEDLVNKSSELE